MVLYDRERVENAAHLPLVVRQQSDEVRPGKLQLLNALWPFNLAELGAKITIEINIEGSIKFCHDKGLQEVVIDWARQCLFYGLSLPVVIKFLQHLLALLGDVLQLRALR